MRTLSVKTPHGDCPVYVFDAKGGVGPGLLLALDGGGVRPAMFQMAEEMAAEGFTVIVPDLFYRVGHPFDLLPEGQPKTFAGFFGQVRADPSFRGKAMAVLGGAGSPDNVREVFGGVMQLIDEQLLAPKGPVKAGKLGITGYCMGGGVAFRVGAQFPERIGAVASFHGGNLATTAPESPHLGVPKLKANVFVAGAVEDNSYTPEMRDRLVDALKAAGVKHTVETWDGALHGFSVPDTPVFKPEFGKRHHDSLLQLLTQSI